MRIKERGITLIALVVTIIVLLLLAGVSIRMITGQSGILTMSKDATQKAEELQIREQIDFAKVKSINPNTAKVNAESFEQRLDQLKTDGVIESYEYSDENIITVYYKLKGSKEDDLFSYDVSLVD